MNVIHILAVEIRNRMEFVYKYEAELEECTPEQLEMIADALLCCSQLSYRQSYPIMTDSTSLSQTKFEERFLMYGIHSAKQLAQETM